MTLDGFRSSRPSLPLQSTVNLISDHMPEHHPAIVPLSRLCLCVCVSSLSSFSKWLQGRKKRPEFKKHSGLTHLFTNFGSHFFGGRGGGGRGARERTETFIISLRGSVWHPVAHHDAPLKCLFIKRSNERRRREDRKKKEKLLENILFAPSYRHFPLHWRNSRDHKGPSSLHFGTILGILIEFPDEGRLVAPPAFVNTGLVFPIKSSELPVTFLIFVRCKNTSCITPFSLFSLFLAHFPTCEKMEANVPLSQRRIDSECNHPEGLVLEKPWHLCDLDVHCLPERPRTGSRRFNAPGFTYWLLFLFPVPVKDAHTFCIW